MSLPPLTKKQTIVGGVSIVLIVVSSAIIANSSSRPVLKPEEIQISLTQDILYNPFLAEREIWQVNFAGLFVDDLDLSRNDLMQDSGKSIELLMEATFQTVKEAEVHLTPVNLPSYTHRPENLLIDVKSSRENTMLTAAGVKVYTHKVQTGETLRDISRMYGIDLDTIIGANQNIENIDRIRPGQELKILNSKGVIHRVSHFETLSDISKLYGVDVKRITDHNNLKTTRIKAGDTLIIPGASPSKLEFRGGFSDGFIWPLRGPISSPFGARWGSQHNGIDIVVPENTPIKAARSGVVTFAGWATGYGYAVYIKHDDNTITRYGHMNKLSVKDKDFVYQGQVIGLSGNTGVSTGPHLHFEIRIKDKPVNPMDHLKR